MITVEHLTKQYGDFLAVDDLSFEIGEGHVYGFLGPNGAGKSTTMNIMTGCLSASAGKVSIDGYDIFEQAREAKKRIGYLPEQPPLYVYETPMEYLRFVAQAKGLKAQELESRIQKVMEQTGIERVCHKRIIALSKGYKQRVGIAQALLGNPKVIILDEPTVGLDPLQIIEIRDLIKQLGQEHTVIFSSHILSEVQAICDRIIMINKGKLIAEGSPEELEKNMTSNEIGVLTEAGDEETRHILADITGIKISSINSPGNGLTFVDIKVEADDVRDISRKIFWAFAENKKALLELNVKKASLEDLFIELAGDASAEDAKVREENIQEVKTAEVETAEVKAAEVKIQAEITEPEREEKE